MPDYEARFRQIERRNRSETRPQYQFTLLLVHPVYVQGSRGVLPHRVRFCVVRGDGHRVFDLWCGNMLHEHWMGPVSPDIVCARCERRAVSDGEEPSGREPVSACEATSRARWC